MKILRPLIASALLLMLLLIAYEIMLAWKWDPMAQIKNQPEKAKEDPTVSAPLPAIRFNPVPPAVLPELNTNYMFNETRTAGIKKEEELTGKTTVGVNIKEAYYVGSIIVGNVPKGMIAYAAGGAAPAPGQQAGQGLTRAGISGMKQMLVEAGDNLGGYTVAEIQADRIVFKKASEIVEKFLKDPDKKRTAPAPQPAAAAGKQAVTSKVRNIGGGDDAAAKSAKQAPTPPPPQQSQPAKMSTRVPSAARAKNAPTPPPVVPPIAAQPPAAPAPVPAPPPPTEARQMTPEEIQEMEKEAGGQPEQEETEAEQ